MDRILVVLLETQQIWTRNR